MISEVMAVWKALRVKVREEIREMTGDTVRRERFDVTRAPEGGLIGVSQPFGSEIEIPYAFAVAGARVGDTVLVEWRGSLSTALAISFGEGPRGSRQLFGSLSAGGWAEEGGLWSQSVQAEGIREASVLIVDADMSGAADPAALNSAWGSIIKAESMDNAVKFWAAAAPEDDISVKILEVV